MQKYSYLCELVTVHNMCACVSSARLSHDVLADRTTTSGKVGASMERDELSKRILKLNDGKD